MARIFISYSRNDEDFARQLAKSLSDLGADIWIDIEDIPAGMNWSSAIQQGLQLCDVMIVIVTPGSAASRNVEEEWQYYRDKDKPVIPVLLQPAEVHYQLSRIQYINFHTQDYDTALRQLHTQLKHKGVALKPLSVSEKSVPIPAQKPLAVRDSRQRRYWVIGAAAVAAVLLIAVVGTMINSGQRGQATLTANVISSTTVINTPSATYTSQPSITSEPTNTSITIAAITDFGQFQVAEQDFEHGRMFWIQPRNQIWVMYDNDLNNLSSGQWRVYEDTYKEGDIATDLSIIPPTDKFQPIRSFGKLWRSNQEIRDKLGWGVSPEFGYKAKYEYHPSVMANYEGIDIPVPAFHVLFSLHGEKIEFYELDGTYKMTSPPVEITATVTAN